MKRSCVVVAVVLGILIGGCKPSHEKSAAAGDKSALEDENAASAAFSRFLAACGNGDAEAMHGMLSGVAQETIGRRIREQPQGSDEFARMFKDAEFAAKRIDDHTIELAYNTRLDDRSAPTVVVMAKVDGDWKLSDMRIGDDNSLRVADGRHDTVKCGFQVKKIGLAILDYEEKNRAWPASLRALVDKGVIQASDLKCPATSSNRDCDYFYTPPTPQAFIIACDLAGNHGDARAVFYRDGSVQHLSAAGFEKEMKDPANAEFSKALAAAEKR